jgi:hypothetical protein
VARQAALDVARYDQQGCYSPHVFYVQQGGRVSPQDFAHHLASELAGLQHKLPRRVLSLEEAMQVGAWREAQEFAALNDDRTQLSGTGQSASATANNQRISRKRRTRGPGAARREINYAAASPSNSQSQGSSRFNGRSANRNNAAGKRLGNACNGSSPSSRNPG